jgi:hypothetical protein
MISQAAALIEDYLGRNVVGEWDDLKTNQNLAMIDRKFLEAQTLQSKLNDFKQKFAELKAKFKEGVDFQVYTYIYHIRENMERMIELEEKKIGGYNGPHLRLLLE